MFGDAARFGPSRSPTRGRRSQSPVRRLASSTPWVEEWGASPRGGSFSAKGASVAAATRACFAYFDANSSGFLDYRELRNALRYLGIDTSLPEAIDVLREYDSWPDGKLDLREFSRLVRHAANTS